MKIAIGCDHIVTDIKNSVIKHLESLGHTIIDCGNYNDIRTHYAVYGHAVGVLVAKKEVDFGVVICGTGVGISNSANKTKGIRAVLTHNILVAKKSRELYDANVICLGGRIAGLGLILDTIQTFISTRYLDKNKSQISKINNLVTKENYEKQLFNEIIQD
ncbi:MAG: RpiB/LacA/LacB family sugar-phosphate isomerase [Oscillospiraceae bacterium]